MTTEIATLTSRASRPERLVRDRDLRGRDVYTLRLELRALYGRLVAAWDAALAAERAR